MRKKPAHSHGGGMKENRHNNHAGKQRNFTPRTNFGDGEPGNHRGPRPNNKNAGAAREKYLNLAREAMASGDRVLAENYLQHADHYTRVLAEEGGHIRPEGQQRQRHDRQPRGDEAAPGNSVEETGNRREAVAQEGEAPDNLYGTVRPPRQHHRRQRSHHHQGGAQAGEEAAPRSEAMPASPASAPAFPGLPGSIPTVSD